MDLFLQRHRSVRLLLLVVVGLVFLAPFGCGQKAASTSEVPPVVVGPPYFELITARTGIDMIYRNGEEAGHRAILQSEGGGVALFDFDGDGLLDVFIPGGGKFKDKEILGLPGKLYRNLGNWKFQDVTKEVGLDGALLYSHGAAAADFDNDGWPDLLVSGWGGVTLYHNESDNKGGRRFVDVTRKAGLLGGWHWATSAAWGDLDGDGFPDLYVCQYADWSFANHPTDCTYGTMNKPDICPPAKFSAIQHRLFRNNRDGTFEEVTNTCCGMKDGKPVGLLPGGNKKDNGRGLAVLMVDLNGDGKPDIYVANDETRKYLYMNRSTPGKLLLEEVAQKAGAATDEYGNANGSMGLDAADYNHTGWPSLFVTNYEHELHALYRNNGNESFNYTTHAAGLAVLGNHYVGWGTQFVDVDLDGWEDLVIAHGHVILHPPEHSPRKQSPVLMRNTGGKFKVASQQGGSYFQERHSGRGLVTGDLNNRGRADLVISHVNEPVDVLKNVAETSNHWLGIALAGKNKRDVVGARIVVEVDGGKLTHFAKGGGSYASTSDRRHLIGLGAAAVVRKVTVYWPWGKEQTWEGLQSDRYWKLTEGEAGAAKINYARGQAK